MALMSAVLSAGKTAGSSMMVIWIVVIIAFLFVFMIRPQRKEQQRKQDLMSRLEVGDTVLTSSGFYGVVIDVDDDLVIVEFGNNKNCRIPMQRAAITQIEKAHAGYDDEEKDSK